MKIFQSPVTLFQMGNKDEYVRNNEIRLLTTKEKLQAVGPTRDRPIRKDPRMTNLAKRSSCSQHHVDSKTQFITDIQSQTRALITQIILRKEF